MAAEPEPEPEQQPTSRPFPDALWMWIPDSLRAAFQQGNSEPDPDESYKGHYFKHPRPHLVPIGYSLLLAPFCFVGQLIFPAVPSVAGWLLSSAVGLVWSLVLYIQHVRGRRSR